MASTLVLQYAAATGDQSFINRVEMAMLAFAQSTVVSEAAGTANHANRVVLMKAVTNDPATWAPRFAFICASQGLDASSADTAINNSVAACWNVMAGVQ
jgi:hypothetical protein